MNVDPEDSWLAIGAGISVASLALCWCAVLIRDYRRNRGIKMSRSDTDLTSMIQQEDV